jgi:YrbI family 3-deoxy-D-manno-octulosonate 8-phosphate phosphatase
MKKIAAFIPAKGTSNRVPSKNRQEILGVPMYLWAANNLARVLPNEDIYIDSDCEETLSGARSRGFGTIKRPAELATNATDGNQMMMWQVSNVEAEIYIQHLPPMIFLRAETIKAALSKVVDGGCASSFAVYKTQHYHWDKNGPCYDLKNIPNSVTLEPSITEGMGLYVVRRDRFLQEKKRIIAPFATVDLDHYERIDIDTPDDLSYARTVAKGLGLGTPWTMGLEKMRQRFRPKLLVVDIDGVLTDGGMYYTERGDEMKKFNTKDGLATKRVVSSGIHVAFLSSGINANLIRSRAALLGVNLVHVGTEPKRNILEQWCKNMQIEPANIAYIGDDVNDLEVMRIVGFTACPRDAVEEIKIISTVVLSTCGGNGCLREFVDKYLDLEKT